MEAINLPKNLDIEKSILASLLLNKNAVPMVINKINYEVFYDLRHQSIFSAMTDMYNNNEPIDLVTVGQKLQHKADMYEDNVPYFLMKLSDSFYQLSNLNGYMDLLIDLYKRRKAYEMAKRLESEALDNSIEVDELLPSINKQLIDIQEFGDIDEKTISDIIMTINETRDRKSSGELLGHTTGYNALDATLGGWCPPDLVIVAARPGMGKTAMMLSSIYHACIVNKLPTAIFSLEMSSEQLGERLESIASEIALKRLRMNLIEGAERKHLLKTDDKIIASPLYIDDSGGISVSHLRAKATIWKQKYGIKLIFIDYLQLMSGLSKNNQNREQEVSYISRSLKALAKDLGVPIIALSQLSRRVEERGDKMPQLSDLRESGSIEQDADAVIMLMRPAYYEINETFTISGKEYNPSDLVLCKVEKNRHGKTANIPLRFYGETMTFLDYE